MASATVARTFERVFPFLRYFKMLGKIKDLTIVFLVVTIISIIIVPLPSWLLDFLLALSLSIATLIILMAIFIPKPTDFSTYPTLILLVTLFRLALNIATTRMILSEGHNGPTVVSDIIASFGNFVVGGNYVIGIIVFTILVLVNFMVVTNGSTRVAEVQARFTLDAMPGKQMAIDADMNAGLIDEAEARRRRQEILSEANFYGAMDGASKFVKGDAVASIIITIVNIIGGILIGAFQHGLSIADSASTFTILTIGDGLVGQIPALLIATATGIIITRGSNDKATNFANSAVNELGQNYKVLLIVGAILILFAAVPGLPTLSLGFVGICFLLMALLISDSQDGAISSYFKSKVPMLAELSKGAAAGGTQAQKAAKTAGKEQPKPKEKSAEEQRVEEEKALGEILRVEHLQLDVGYQLIKLADKNQGGDLLVRIRAMRKKIASEYGFVMPQVRICDNLQLEPNTYEIRLKGVTIGSGQVYPGQFLAMNSGLVIEEIDGTPTKEPAFGLDAIWIHPSKKNDATVKGYTIADSATIVTTHITELVKKYAEDMLTRQDVQKLIESLKKDYPVVVEDALKASGGIGLVQKVLKELLHEGIPIRDMLTIMETIADIAQPNFSADILTENVRTHLARTITSLYKDESGKVRIVVLDMATEQRMLSKLKDRGGMRELQLSVGEINAFANATRAKKNELLERGIAQMIYWVDIAVRKSLAEICERYGLDVVVLSHAELDPSATFEVVGTVNINETA
ncbi:flagellar biosynthesis protein FlhA [Campylobacterota bacterium]|nr:flagellar biosynthesis protein FlhA [Campylobacterota bacterium]